MPTPPKSTGLTIWQDLKVLVVSCLLFCFTPLALILMWSWEVWSLKTRKVVTWLGVLAMIAFLACMMICGHGWKGHCGRGWGRGCAMHGWSQGGGDCKDASKIGCHEDGEDEDEDEGDEAEEEEEEGEEAEEKAAEPAKP